MTTEPTEGYRLSPPQQRLWRLQQVATPRPFLVRCAVIIEGQLDARRLEKAVQDVVARHEILRTTFHRRPGISMPLQVPEEGRDAALPVSDWAGREDSEQALLKTLWEEFGAQPFDLEQGPPLRLALHRLAEERHVLLVALSAFCADAAGLDNLVSEIVKSFAGQAHSVLKQADAAVADAELTQYVVFAEWQNELLETDDAAVGREFWRTKDLSSLPHTRLYCELGKVEADKFVPRSICVKLLADISQRIDALAENRETTPATVLLACWQALLSRLAMQSVIVVAVGCDGRSDEELMQALGLFVKHLPVVSFVAPRMRFSDLLAAADKSMREAYDWQECFTWDLLPKSDEQQAGVPFFAYGFDYSEYPAPLTADGLSFRVAKADACTDRFKLQLSFHRKGSALQAEFRFDPNVFDAGDVERVGRQYNTLLESALERPESTVSALELLDEDERQRVLYDFNDTRLAFQSDKLLHRLVEQRVECTPDATAILFGDERLTYNELNKRANCLAHRLRSLGVGPDVTVGVCFERSTKMVVALLGVLKAGGAYVPVDPGYPKERVSLIVTEARPAAIITQRYLAPNLTGHTPPVVVVDDEQPPFAAESTENPAVDVAEDNLAYVIYTSGSTGRPKGVMISHRAIANRLLWMQAAFPLDAGDRLLQKTSISFDASVWEVFVPLIAGATLVLAEPDGHQDPSYLVRAVKEHGITVLQLVPSMLRLFLAELGVSRCISLRRLFCGGEALPGELQEQFYALLSAELHNLYGPTEVSIDATTHPCAPGRSEDVVPIGKPLSNVQVYLLNEYQEPVAVGMAGELYVGGAGLARGYHTRPELTAERFLPNPFSSEPGSRLYRTGDIARYRVDGTIEFLGRSDHQVKVRGFRIELGEIESALKRHAGVREAVAVASEDQPGNQQIVAYVVPAESGGQGPNGDRHLYRLPNEMQIAHLNKNETDLLYKEIFDDEAYLKHGVTLEDGDCVFDVGANIGLFTLFVHSKCRRAQVFSFEPSPPTFDALKTNVELHGLNVKPYQCAISDRTGSAQFTFYPKVSASSGLYADAAEEARVTRTFIENQGELGRYADELLEGRFESVTYTCELRTISDIIRENGVERIDLLKVDVEKSELHVLQGIAAEDWQKVGQIVMEVHDTDGRLQAITELLERHGFRLQVDQYSSLKQTGLYNIYAVSAQGARKQQATIHDAKQNDGFPRRLRSPNRHAISSQLLRDYVAESLPEYMVPSAIVLLDKLPLTPNGKLNRQALPNPASSTPVSESNSPRTPMEEFIAGVFAKVLGREHVGAQENFFELGGHSLLATQVISRLREYLQSEVPLQLIFEATTADELATRLEAFLKLRAGVETPPLSAVTRRDGFFPLSFAQQRLWFLDQLEPGNTYFNIPAVFRLNGTLDAELLEQTLNEVIRRHEMLRTTFAEVDGQPVQVVCERRAIPVTVVDLSNLPATEREARAQAFVSAEVERPFDLSAGPLLRAHVLRLDAEEHIAVLMLHHIVADGWSIGVLVREAMALYDAFKRGELALLPELPIQYADYAVWQRGWLQGDALDALLSYWRHQLGGTLPVLKLPTDRPLPPVQTYNGARRSFRLPEALTKELRLVGRHEGATLFMTLLAGFNVLLHRCTKQKDIVVGTDIANRNRLEVEGLIGFFINQVVLRTDLAGDPTFRQLLSRVRTMTLGAYAHQDLPFEKLVDHLRPERDLRRAPLFQVKLVLQNAPFETLELRDLTISPFDLTANKAHLHLALFMRETDDGMTGLAEFNTDLFDPATIERMLAHFELVLTRAAAKPDARLSELAAAIDAAEQQRSKAEKEKLAAASHQKFKNLKPKTVQMPREQLARLAPLEADGSLPLVISPLVPAVDLVDWTRNNRALIEEKVAQHGALLFRGFSFRPHSEFARFAEAVCNDLFDENGEHPRQSLGDHIYTPVFYPADQQLLWHNENSFNYRWPVKLWFCCAQPAERGGETPIVDSRQVFAQLNPRIRQRFISKGVMYVRNHGGGLGLSWQEVFQTNDRAKVERLCREAKMELEWKDGDRALTRCVRPAVVRHPRMGEMTWFNQAQHWHTSCLDPQTREAITTLYREEDYPRNCYYGDGLPIEDSVMQEILEIYRDAQVIFPWQAGDILMLDNLLTAHGRQPFTGERKLLVAMGEMRSYDDVESA